MNSSTRCRFHTAILVCLATTSLPDSAPASVLIDLQPPPATLDTVQLRLSLTIEGAGSCLLERVVAMELTTDNQLFVADRRAAQLCHYDETGKLVQVIGRKGEGPGEFSNLAWLTRLPGDTIVALDGTLMRLSFFSPNGKLVRTVRLSIPSSAKSRSLTAFEGMSNGLFLVGFSDVQRLEPTKTAVPFGQSLYLFDTNAKLVGAAGDAFDSEHFVQTVPLRFGGTAYWDLAFGRRAAVSAAWGGAYAYIDGETSTVKLFNASGSLAATLTAPISRRAVTPTDIARYSASEMMSTSADQRPLQTLRLEEMPYPVEFPTFGRLFTGTNGALFAQEYIPPAGLGSVSRWYSWSGKGSPVRVLQAGGEIRGMAASHDRLCGLTADADGVDAVVCYSMQ